MSATKQSDEPKEGDEVRVTGKVEHVTRNADGSNCIMVKVEADNGNIYHFRILPDMVDMLRKVRPGTYEVTAREVAKMICRAYRESNMFFLVRGKLARLAKRKRLQNTPPLGA